MERYKQEKILSHLQSIADIVTKGDYKYVFMYPSGSIKTNDVKEVIEQIKDIGE